jgi:hypothetical protein
MYSIKVGGNLMTKVNKHLAKAERLLMDTHRLVKESEEYAAIAEQCAQDARNSYNILLKNEQDYKTSLKVERQLNDILGGK